MYVMQVLVLSNLLQVHHSTVIDVRGCPLEMTDLKSVTFSYNLFCIHDIQLN